MHPEVVLPVRLNRRVVDERTLRAVSSFILLYIGIFVVGTALLAIDAARTGLELSVFDAVAACATTLGNVGPGFGIAGPYGSFEPFSDFSTLRHGRPDVARPARGDPDRRARLTPLLADRVTPG